MSVHIEWPMSFQGLQGWHDALDHQWLCQIVQFQPVEIIVSHTSWQEEQVSQTSTAAAGYDLYFRERLQHQSDSSYSGKVSVELCPEANVRVSTGARANAACKRSTSQTAFSRDIGV